MATNTPANNPAATRTRWRRQLLQESEATAQRLTEAYQRTLPFLKDNITLLEGRLQQIIDAGGDVTVTSIKGLAQYQDLLTRIEREMQSFAAIARDQAYQAQQLALQFGSDAALDMVMLQAGDVGRIIAGVWNQPDPAALAQLINYVDGAAMRDRFGMFGTKAADNLADVILAGVAQGKNPRAIAGLINTWFAVPLSWAENMTRTVQLWSYRSASHAAYRANPEVVTGWMWWAALDTRTCLSCIAKHGTIYETSQILNDHHRGRCTPLPIVKGTTWTQSVQAGPDWFQAQPRGLQLQIMGASMHRAYSDGVVGWKDFSVPYQDGVYGEMLREASLKDLLGNGAKRYY